MSKKVELLAPAGGYETMVGAFNAGADAVYLGGSKFGARAYADNFDTQQVLDAVSYAHLHGKRIYLTVNTLVKENEFGQVYDFMVPYAEKGLDGVIVQDLGVMRLIGREFPGIELHASTQQTVTGVYGAKLLKELGCCRVVPARELSLQEMRDIREKADVEVEAFIHGAMCYCYSGACLFSSMIGGRSGNRGRCAQPCRLPYKTMNSKGEVYPLSLKDMSTIGMIPELIEAGIDSFKIEGRMKKPEYSAGVTALYRKYIDMYYAQPEGEYKVSKEDMEMLKNLYQRTGISDGYYHRHNGKTMVTVSSPAYNSTSEEVLSAVREKYLRSELKIDCHLECRLTVGEPAHLAMKADKDGKEYTKEAVGSAVQSASKRPMDEESIKKQLKKLGNTPFEAKDIKVSIDDQGTGLGIFVAVSELNELRREVCDKMMEELLSQVPGAAGDLAATCGSVAGVDASFDAELYESSEKADNKGTRKLKVLVNTKDQLFDVIKAADSCGYPSTLILSGLLILGAGSEEKALIEKAAAHECSVYAALPFITRKEDDPALDGIKLISDIVEKCTGLGIGGLLVRNLEQLSFLKESGYKGDIITDYGVYNWNKEAVLELLACNDRDRDFFIKEISVPYELTLSEGADLVKAYKKDVKIPCSYNIYGHIPMMISAGCVKLTMDKCSGKRGELHRENLTITDRMGNDLKITADCRNCMNTIWNPHPTSLHKKLSDIQKMGIFEYFRIDFTVEKGKRAGEVYEFYADLLKGEKPFDIFEKTSYTTGHFTRGVE
ncbi:MAG: U32 family peptidase [Butyrivibrio sp.]|nr:U32 family peptidase [Butyrivibrio sp.]